MELIPLLDLTRQTRAIGPECEAAIRRVMQRGLFILGPEVARFEKNFALFCQSSFGIGVASGTDALELALRSSGIGPGDLVATVSFTFMATVDAILHVGASPLFIDIDPQTYTMDPGSLEERIRRLVSSARRRLKVILPVHLYGHPCDMDSLRSIAQKYRLLLIEDAAQAAGARWKGKPVGGFGEAGCFSFFPSKNLGAFGDGGMVVTNSAERAARIRSLRVHGRGKKGEERELGRNSRLDELQAAVLNVKQHALARWLSLRRRIAQFYTKQLSGLPDLVCPTEAPEATHAFGLYVIRSPHREAIRERMRRRGIMTQVYYPTPIHRQPLHRKKVYARVKLPETERASQEVLALPLFPELRTEELIRICRAVKG